MTHQKQKQRGEKNTKSIRSVESRQQGVKSTGIRAEKRLHEIRHGFVKGCVQNSRGEREDGIP